MTAAVAGLQKAFQAFSTAMGTDLTAITTALGNLRNSQTLGQDDLTEITNIESALGSIQSRTDALANPATIPAAPVSVALSADGKGGVVVTFPQVPGAVSYGINRGTVAGQEVPVGSVPDGTNPTFTDSGLVVGTQYFYTVTAINTAGTSPASAEVSVTA